MLERHGEFGLLGIFWRALRRGETTDLMLERLNEHLRHGVDSIL